MRFRRFKHPLTCVPMPGTRLHRRGGAAPFFIVILLACLWAPVASAQIDPVKRQLFQLGYNAALEGHPPLSAYAYYYYNQPEFLQTNLTLRLALSPTYLDSELGLKGWPGAHTELGFGIAGGGFDDSYYEIRHGAYLPKESFDGYGGRASISVYQLLNPGHEIPLYFLARGTAHFVTYDPRAETAAGFSVPDDMGIFSVRTGIRWGGREPTLFPSLAMELSIWQDSEFRTRSGLYGFSDREIEANSHLFWAEAFLAYTLPELQHTFTVSLTAGTSINADRISAYRVGGFLPMISEFPLSLPGYFYQELSAEEFVVAAGTYWVPLDRRKRLNLTVTAATAALNYLDGLEEPGRWRSGVGGGLFYTSPTWRIMVGYGYGIDAIRSDGHGAHTIGLLLQFDLAPAREAFFKPEPPGRWRGFQRIFGVLGS